MQQLFSSRLSNGGDESQGGRKGEQKSVRDRSREASFGRNDVISSCFSCWGKKSSKDSSLEVENSLGMALDELDWIIRENAGRGSVSKVEKMKLELGLAQTLHLCKNKWAENVRGKPALRILEDIILKRCQEIHLYFLRFMEADDEEERGVLLDSESDFLHHEDEIVNAMKVPFRILSHVLLLHNAASSSHFDMGDLLFDFSFRRKKKVKKMGDLLNIIDSLLHIVPLLPMQRFRLPLHLRGLIPATIRFLKNFILFASSFQGVPLVRSQTKEHLFIHVELSVIHFVCSILGYMFPDEFDLYQPWRMIAVDDDFHRCMRMIEPLEPHVCGIYVGALQELALQFPQSSIIHPRPAASHDHTPAVLQDFVDSLLFLLLKLFLFRGSSRQYIFHHQICKLYQALEFLKTTLREHHDDKVGHQQYEKMHDHIRPVICIAGIIICSLFMETENEEGLVENLEFLFSDFDEKFKLFKGVEEETLIYCLASATCFPQTNLKAFIESLLEKMESVNASAVDSTVAFKKDEFQTIHTDLSFLRSFLVDVMQESNQNEKLRTLLGRVAAIAYETEFVLDTLMSGRDLQSIVMMLHTIIEEIKCIKVEASNECSQSKEKMFQVKDVTKNDSKMPSIGKLSEVNEHVVGLDVEIQNIVDQLRSGLTGKLDIVSIVGMAGLGKTTLAKKVYRHPSIAHHFRPRSWCTVSQVYNKKILLLEILRGIDGRSADKYLEMDENELAQKLYQRLKGERYLIILDDVWDVKAWSDLNNSFPDDTKGSRILLTSRLENVALQIKPHSQSPHCLRLLTDDESWELFQMKVCTPSEHHDRGKAMVKRCKGLPLMIVVIAGLLSNMEPSSWDEVEGSLTKGKDQCIDAIALSYSHLPPHLKLCFLSFGAFAEDHNIRVREMLWLWIAENLVQENGRDCIEDVAEGYMMELVQRNLVMVAGKQFGGRVKSCVLHDLLHEFCVEKANEEHFLHHLHGREIGTSIEPCTLHRLRVFCSRVEDFAESRLHCPRLRTLFFLTDHKERLPFSPPWYGILYKFCQSNFLGVLDLTGIFGFTSFPHVILLLVRLRYLALSTGTQMEFTSLEWEIPSSIEHLSNLETFIVHGDVSVILPNTIWNMKNIRHLYRSSPSGYGWALSKENPKSLSYLENLQSFCRVRFSCYQTMKEVIKKCPNIRKLKCILLLKREVTECADFKIIALDCLSRLESLCVNDLLGVKLDFHFLFPQNLKKLILIGLGLPWSKISTVDRLPNLEVLKLEGMAFEGEHWEMEEEEDEDIKTFPRLRFLKLKNLDLARWTGPDDIFPCLEKLVLKNCDDLVELPSSSLGTSSTLQIIEVTGCKRAKVSIEQIQEMQIEFGNDELKIVNNGKSRQR